MPIRITGLEGRCSAKTHQVGQVITVDGTTPAGVCLGAWNAMAPYITALRYGANFPWSKEKGATTIHCPDPQGLTLRLERVEE